MGFLQNYALMQKNVQDLGYLRLKVKSAWAIFLCITPGLLLLSMRNFSFRAVHLLINDDHMSLW